jgi:flagellar motor switch protein FliN
MADESTTDPQGQGPEGAERSEQGAPVAGDTHRSEQLSAPQPSAASDAERALKAAQDAIHGLEVSASEEIAAGMDAGRQSAETAETIRRALGAETPADPARSGEPAGQPVDLPRFDARDAGQAGAAGGAGGARGLDLLSDVNLNVRIELGRTRMLVEDVLRLGEGAVVELDKLAGDPVDVFVNGRHVARGEVLVLNDNFCIRISEILDEGKERVQR